MVEFEFVKGIDPLMYALLISAEASYQEMTEGEDSIRDDAQYLSTYRRIHS